MEIFTTLREAQVLIEQWRRHYNAVRPHSSLGYQPPAPEAEEVQEKQTSKTSQSQGRSMVIRQHSCAIRLLAKAFPRQP